MVGQVLWRNTRGVEKDIRTLLNEAESEVKLYAISSSVAHEAALMDVLDDYKKSGRYPDLYKIKIIRIPPDLDLDKEKELFSVRKIVVRRLGSNAQQYKPQKQHRDLEEINILLLN